MENQPNNRHTASHLSMAILVVLSLSLATVTYIVTNSLNVTVSHHSQLEVQALLSKLPARPEVIATILSVVVGAFAFLASLISNEIPRIKLVIGGFFVVFFNIGLMFIVKFLTIVGAGECFGASATPDRFADLFMHALVPGVVVLLVVLVVVSFFIGAFAKSLNQRQTVNGSA